MKYKAVEFAEQLQEGKIPKTYVRDSNGKLYELMPDDDENNDPYEGLVPETDTYILDGKEEFYDWVTTCKSCECQFIAYVRDENKRYNLAMNYCPGCGEKLK